MMNKIDSNKKNENDLEEALNLSTTLTTEGFDLQAGETWIYPTNYSLREYQYNIIQKALLNNTMVSLPTGLGKTFIAAVVMYNFYRWYPLGKIIFMAPTKPLVTQQIDACYNIMAIPKEVTAELTGTKHQNYRKDVWNEKRVFFITPQVLQNDLNILNEFAPKIKCLVFDEAHKAKGNHAYCEVIRKIVPHNKNFRVIGLSATPGNSLTDVLEVIKNLLISHIEIRTDDSKDVLPYVYQRSLETCVVPLGGKLEEVKDTYSRIVDKYTRVLANHKIISGTCSTITKGRIFMTLKNFKENPGSGRIPAYSEIMRTLNICVTLYHAFELLVRHGLRGFLSFFEEHSEKPLLRGNTDLKVIMRDVAEYLGPAPNVVPLPDGSIEEIPESIKFGHPKFYKLRDILSEHFSTTKETESRVIVFCEYRESVMEAYALLLRHRPLIKPRIFLGQGAITQRQQINVIKSFRGGECNTLISTCIGEEGLDVGDVDLIICFDISSKSPVRMIQRMGRTGRKREGRIVVLVTEGKEQQTLNDCLIHKQNLSSHILQSSMLHKELYAENPRMVPDDIEPKSQKLFITVQQDKKKKPSSSSIKDLFDNISKNQNNPVDNEVEIIETEDKLPVRQDYWNKVNPLSIEMESNCLDFSRNISKLRVPQPTGKIGHSKSTDLLLSVLQFADSKKYNISTTQIPVLSSQANQAARIQQPTSNVLRQTDIRNMFSKPSSSSQLSQISEGESDVNIKNILEKCTRMLSSIKLHTQEVVDCRICENLFSCSQYSNINVDFDIRTCIEVDNSIMNCLTETNLNFFLKSLDVVENKSTESYDMQSKPDSSTWKIGEDMNVNNSILFAQDSLIDKTMTVKESPFKPPHNVQLLENCGITSSFIDFAFNDTSFTQKVSNVAHNVSAPKISSNNQVLPALNFEDFEKAEITQLNKNTQQNKITSSFIDLAFNDTSFTQKVSNVAHNVSTPKISSNNQVLPALNFEDFEKAEITQLNKNAEQNFQETLSFFNMTSLEELFEESSPKLTSQIENVLEETIIYSPGDYKQANTVIQSPILSCRLQYSRNQVPKRLFNESKPAAVSSNNSSDIFIGNSFVKDKNTNQSKTLSEKEDFSEEDLFDESDMENVIPRENQQSKIEVEDLIDLSVFGLGGRKEETKIDKELPAKSGKTNGEVIKDNFCDNSIFDMFFANNNQEDNANQTNKVEKEHLNDKNNDIEVIILDDTLEDERLTPSKEMERIQRLNNSSPTRSLVENSKNNLEDIEKSPTLSKSQYHYQGPRLQNMRKNLGEDEQTSTKLSLKNGLSNKINKNVGISSMGWYKKGCPNKTPDEEVDRTSPILSSQNRTFRPSAATCPVKALHSDNSDDDFELPSKKNYSWIKKRPNPVKQIVKLPAVKKKSSLMCNRKENSTRKAEKRKANDCEYLDLEAEVSINNNASLDSSISEENDDAFEASFVDDETQNMANTSVMHAHYIQSVKSPIMNRGKFKIPQLQPFAGNVYSQVVQESENYVNDTFCVTSEDENSPDKQDNMSELELAELILEQQRKKRRKPQSSDEKPNKKRRMVVLSSSDSE